LIIKSSGFQPFDNKISTFDKKSFNLDNKFEEISIIKVWHVLEGLRSWFELTKNEVNSVFDFLERWRRCEDFLILGKGLVVLLTFLNKNPFCEEGSVCR
jgi:hypothetical protein